MTFRCIRLQEWIPFCVALDNIMHPALLFPSGMSFLTTKEGMTFVASAFKSGFHLPAPPPLRMDSAIL